MKSRTGARHTTTMTDELDQELALDSTTRETTAVPDAANVMRRAVARARNDIDEPASPNDTTVNGSMDGLFSDDGSLRDPTDLSNDSRDPVEVYEDWLSTTDESAYEHYQNALDNDEKYGDRSREELLRAAIKMAFSNHDTPDELDLPSIDDIHGSVPQFLTHQEHRETLSIDRDEDEIEELEGGKLIDECPECEEENVRVNTIEVQTRAADESGTQISKSSCGCTYKRSD